MYRLTICIIGLFLWLAASSVVIADSTDVKPKKVEIKSKKIEGVKNVNKPAVQKNTSGSYDSFTDKNNNGIDDKYEQAEKKRVKVQEVKQPKKPVRKEPKPDEEKKEPEKK